MLNIPPAIYLDLWEILGLQFPLIYLQLNIDSVMFFFNNLWLDIGILEKDLSPSSSKTSSRKTIN